MSPDCVSAVRCRLALTRRFAPPRILSTGQGNEIEVQHAQSTAHNREKPNHLDNARPCERSAENSSSTPALVPVRNKVVTDCRIRARRVTQPTGNPTRNRTRINSEPNQIQLLACVAAESCHVTWPPLFTVFLAGVQKLCAESGYVVLGWQLRVGWGTGLGCCRPSDPRIRNEAIVCLKKCASHGAVRDRHSVRHQCTCRSNAGFNSADWKIRAQQARQIPSMEARGSLARLCSRHLERRAAVVYSRLMPTTHSHRYRRRRSACRGETVAAGIR